MIYLLRYKFLGRDFCEEILKYIYILYKLLLIYHVFFYLKIISHVNHTNKIVLKNTF